MLEPFVVGDQRFEVVSQLKRRCEVNRVQGSKFVWVQAAGRGEHARRNRQQRQSVEEGRVPPACGRLRRDGRLV